METLRRPDTAQGNTTFWASGSSLQRSADQTFAEAKRGIRGHHYHTTMFELVGLYKEALAEDGGKPVDTRVFAAARDLLEALPYGFAVPEIGLDPDGEVAMDWLKENREMVSVSVSPTGALSYAAKLRDRTAHGVILFNGGFPTALTELLRGLYHPV